MADSSSSSTDWTVQLGEHEWLMNLAMFPASHTTAPQVMHQPMHSSMKLPAKAPIITWQHAQAAPRQRQPLLLLPCTCPARCKAHTPLNVRGLTLAPGIQNNVGLLLGLPRSTPRGGDLSCVRPQRGRAAGRAVACSPALCVVPATWPCRCHCEPGCMCHQSNAGGRSAQTCSSSAEPVKRRLDRCSMT